MSHDFLKKDDEYPSGLGALSLPELKRAFLITSLETGAKRKSKWVSSRQGPL
jgi:hypothetical protein